MGGACCSNESKDTSNTVPNKKKGRKGRKTNSTAGYESDSLNETSHSASESYNEVEMLKREWKKAVQNSDNRKLKTLFQNHYKKVDFRKVQFENGDNSLHFAVRSGNVNLTKFLLLIRTNVNQQNNRNGNTALHYAAQKNDSQQIKLLFSAKKQTVKTNIHNNRHETAKDIARLTYNEQILNLIHSLENGRNNGNNNNNYRRKSPRQGPTDPLTANLINNGGIGDNSLGTKQTSMGNNISSHSYSHGSHREPAKLDGIDGDSFVGNYAMDTSLHGMLGDHNNNNNNESGGSRGSRGGGRGYTDSDNDDISRGSVSLHITGRALGDKISNEDVILQAWLDKKRHKAPHIWQRRYVLLNKQCMLWSEKEIKTDDHHGETNKEFTDQFAGYVEVSNIISVANKHSKEVQNKFIIRCKNTFHKNKTNQKEKEYMFRCESEQIRDKWVNELSKLLLY